MNKEIEKLIKRRCEKVEGFLLSMSTNLPVFQSSVPLETVNIYNNKKMRGILSDALLRYIKKTSESSRFKSVRVRHTLEDIANKDFCLDELTDRGRESVYAVFMSRIKECNLMDDTELTDLITEKFLQRYFADKIDTAPKIAWEVILGSMIVDTMQDTENKWLDVWNSISYMAKSKYQDTEIIVPGNKLDKIMDISDDYINYVTMLLGINLLNFTKKLDDESKTQILGNIGDIIEFKTVANTVFLMELLSTSNIDAWLLGLLVDHVDIFM